MRARNLAAVRARLGNRVLGGEAVAAIGRPGFGAAMATVLAERTGTLCAALCRGDADAACEHGKRVVGLGPGLTPSGDDFLVGLFAVLHLPGSPCERFRAICAEIVDQTSSGTNAISAAALRAAAAGRVRQSIGAFIHELMHGRREGLLAALARVLAIGSTSGSDIVAGIVSGLEINLQVGEVASCR